MSRMVLDQILVWFGLLHKMADSTLSRQNCIFPKCRMRCASKAILSTFLRLSASMHKTAQKLLVCSQVHCMHNICIRL